MSKKIIFLCGLCLWLLLPACYGAERGTIGLSVLKESFNPVNYRYGTFVKNDIGTIDINRLNGEEEITGYLNQMNMGKRVLNALLGYSAENGKSSELWNRIPADRQQAAAAADTLSAVLNNYLLIVKLDNASREAVLRGDTLRHKLQGAWYLYRLDFDMDNLKELRSCLVSRGDDAAQRGEKRAQYDALSLVVRLTDMGEGVDAKLIQKLEKKIKYIDAKQAKQTVSSKLKSPSTAVKVALSPLIIVK